MPWIIYVFGSVLLFSAATLLQKVLMKGDKSDPYVYSIVFQLLGSLVLGVYAVIAGFQMPPIFQHPLNYFLIGILYGLGTVCLFNALKYIDASQVTIITSVRSVVTVIAAVLLLGEQFTLLRAVGVLLILSSILVISGKKGKFTFNKGFLYAFAMAVCYGLAITNDTFLLRQNAHVYSFAAVGFLLPGLFLAIANPKKTAQIPSFFKLKTFLRMLFMTIFYASAVLLFYLAINAGAPLAQATPILQSTVILTVLLAAIFLREREMLPRKILGALLVVLGVILLT